MKSPPPDIWIKLLDVTWNYSKLSHLTKCKINTTLPPLIKNQIRMLLKNTLSVRNKNETTDQFKIDISNRKIAKSTYHNNSSTWKWLIYRSNWNCYNLMYFSNGLLEVPEGRKLPTLHIISEWNVWFLEYIH